MALALAGCGAGAGLAGDPSAAGAVAVLLAWLALGPGALPGLARRLLPMLASFALLFLLLPLAPQATASVLLRGFAVSLAVVGATAAAGGAEIAGVLAAMGAPRVAVAFLLVLARHVGEVREETTRAFRALALRGGWDRWRSRPRAVAALLAAVLDAGLHRADRLAEALALRGFEGRLPPPAPFRAEAQLPHLAAAAAVAVSGLAPLVSPAWRAWLEELAVWSR